MKIKYIHIEIWTEMPSLVKQKGPPRLFSTRAELFCLYLENQSKALHLSYNGFLLAHLGFQPPGQPGSTGLLIVIMLCTAFMHQIWGSSPKRSTLPSGPQLLTPCSLLIIWSFSVIVAWTCTFFRWWFWHQHRALPKKAQNNGMWLFWMVPNRKPSDKLSGTRL